MIKYLDKIYNNKLGSVRDCLRYAHQTLGDVYQDVYLFFYILHATKFIFSKVNKYAKRILWPVGSSCHLSPPSVVLIAIPPSPITIAMSTVNM